MILKDRFQWTDSFLNFCHFLYNPMIKIFFNPWKLINDVQDSEVFFYNFQIIKKTRTEKNHKKIIFTDPTNFSKFLPFSSQSYEWKCGINRILLDRRAGFSRFGNTYVRQGRSIPVVGNFPHWDKNPRGLWPGRNRRCRRTCEWRQRSSRRSDPNDLFGPLISELRRLASQDRGQ